VAKQSDAVAKQSDKEQCSSVDKELGSYPAENRPITLGAMVRAIQNCVRNPAGLRSLSHILRRQIRRPRILASAEWRDIYRDRDRVTPESRTAATIEDTRIYLRRRRDFLSILEDPPLAEIPSEIGHRRSPGRPRRILTRQSVRLALPFVP
jgi:hypothetical protein